MNDSDDEEESADIIFEVPSIEEEKSSRPKLSLQAPKSGEEEEDEKQNKDVM